MARMYVLTGGSGSGKSSLILALEKKGEAVMRETAEDYIRLRQAQGIAEPWTEEDFQENILQLQIQREKDAAKIARSGRVWLDRSVLDGLAYEQKAGRPKGSVARKIMAAARNYRIVFIIENLGHCRSNEVRRENQEEALELEKMQEQNYREAGYEVVRITPTSVNKRAEQVLEWARKHEER